MITIRSTPGQAGPPMQAVRESTCPLPVFDHKEIVLGHGSGGKLTSQLIEDVFLPAFGNPALNKLDDQAVLTVNGSRLAFTTDSYVVTPIFFPGGDIGQLAVNGTINDLAMCGARPLYLAAAFILEEGLSLEDLRQVVGSMKKAAEKADVFLVAGDTKVVNHGKGDKLFITTTGVGVVDRPLTISSDRAQVGDKIILSGYIGDHGMAILSCRESLEFEGSLESDTAPLHSLVAAMLEITNEIHCMRDPTRGGLATTLNEIAGRSGVGMLIEEASLPVRDTVQGACEILGLDPLYVANEGKLVAVVPEEHSAAIVQAMQQHEFGRHARVIGEVVKAHAGMVRMKTLIGGTRILDLLFSEPLPRIC